MVEDILRVVAYILDVVAYNHGANGSTQNIGTEYKQGDGGNKVSEDMQPASEGTRMADMRTAEEVEDLQELPRQAVMNLRLELHQEVEALAEASLVVKAQMTILKARPMNPWEVLGFSSPMFLSSEHPPSEMFFACLRWQR